jgi:hypothetical protein
MRIAFACFIFLTSAAGHAAMQNKSPAIVTRQLNYGDLADFALASNLIAHVQIQGVKPLKGPMAQGTPAGHQRLLIEAKVIALLKAPDSQAARLEYLIDLPVDSRGRFAKLKKVESLIFARPIRSGEIQLIAPDAWVTWSEDYGQTVRSILTAAAQTDVAPHVSGIASAFHSPGSLPGEGETQIFLTTRDNRPASLTVQRRADTGTRWFVSLGEVVDEGVSQPAKNTLLWYRLACFLPQIVPDSLIGDQSETARDEIKRDYSLIRQSLGPCVRARASRSFP